MQRKSREEAEKRVQQESREEAEERVQAGKPGGDGKAGRQEEPEAEKQREADTAGIGGYAT